MNLKSDNTTECPKKPKSKEKPKRLSVKFSLAVVIIAILMIAGVFTGLMPGSRQNTELNAKTQESSILTVTVVSPKPGQSTSNLPLPAEVKPWVEARIYARATGYLKRWLVDMGAHVEAGQLLAEIDVPELNEELERARAQLAQAQAALEISKITAERWAGLVKTASVSEQENAEKQADFKLKSALAAAARAEVRRLETLDSYTRITAPFSGIITARNVDTGDLITANAGKELFRLAQTRKLRVFVQVPQAMARSIRVGQTAEMTVPEIPGRVLIPKVVRTAGVIAPDSRTLLVELELDNPKGEVLAGSYAQVRFTESKMEAALVLPSNTVLFRPEGPQVAIVQPDGKVELRTVKLGRDFGQTIEILEGVSANDRVIVNPPDSLTSGTVVSIVQPDKKEDSR
jgi:RND family efflux transporter MFP subunit